VTGLHGMNVPYPGSGRARGAGASFLIMAVMAVLLYVAFRRKDWL
jgi:magnesium transporter